MTLKYGSKGTEVKQLQEALAKAGYKVTVDGIFGKGTEKEVINYQYDHNLTPDGVVGPKTWDSLNGKTPALSSKAVFNYVVYDALKVHVSKSANRPIKYIVIHYTGSGNSRTGRATSTKKTFESRSASADFCIDDTTIVQFTPDIRNYYCWHCGDSKYVGTKGAKFYGKCTNKNSIGIEICSTNTTGDFDHSNHSGWKYTDSVLNLAVKLVKDLMRQFNIPSDNVIRHYDVSGKHCPGIIGWNDEPIYDKGKKTSTRSDSSEWLKFKKRLG